VNATGIIFRGSIEGDADEYDTTEAVPWLRYNTWIRGRHTIV